MFTKDRLEKMKKADLVSLVMLLQAQGLEPMNKDSQTEVIQDFKWIGRIGTKIVKINGKKFKIYAEYTNGSPLGFNYKHSASVMDTNGSWKYVASIADLTFKTVWYGENNDVCKENAEAFCDEMQKYLEKIYS